MNHSYTPKPTFIERIKLLLKDSRKDKIFLDPLNSKEEFRVEEDINKFFEFTKFPPKKSFRVNTLKISPNELINKLKKYNWEILQPFKEYPEIMIINSKLEPGELGKKKEHILGYYYVQEITSMMPIIALSPKPNEILLDLCAAPGSKTTQAAAQMQNSGTIIANDVSIGRIAILSANLEKCGVTNSIITRHDGKELCQKLEKLKFEFPKNFDLKHFSSLEPKNAEKHFFVDKILVDAPCSGEGNIRTSPRTYLEWSENLVKNLGKKQKKLLEYAFNLLKENGELVYSTCTYAPEENEEVIQNLLDKFDNIKIESINLPLKTREGISEWKGKTFSKELKKAVRIYHHDNDMEGFFLCKMRKISHRKQG